ncbi:MAG: ATP-binding protein [Gammaproteobacteria bacterium]|nr:ATP-binding protein [Gammaproteobacteria bacterium]
MSTTDDLVQVLRKLRLSGVLHTMPLRVKQCAEDNLDATEFLYRLLCDELERREAKKLLLRLRDARFEHGKSLEDFDFTFNPKIPKSQLIEIATCTFIDRHDNVLLVGPCGVGKSHLAQAIGHRAVRRGHKVLFTTGTQLFRDLRAGRGDGSFERRMLKYTKPHLLIVDDVGLRPLRGDEPEDLHDIVRNRYERGSVIFTSNRDVAEWPPLFGDPLMASAAMDRLLHHAHIVILDGQSYRNPKNRYAA